MRTFFRVIARIIAAIFAIIFIFTTIFAILANTFESKIFNPNLYKSSLDKLGLYQEIPKIVGEMMASTITSNPCSKNPLICENNSAELNACYLQTLGNERYNSLTGEGEEPTEDEIQAIQPCLQRYGPDTNQYKLATAQSEVQTCVRGIIGEDAFSEIVNYVRPPTEIEDGFIQGCLEFASSSMNPQDVSGPPDYIKNLKASDWETILSLILAPADIKTITEDLLDNLFAYINGEKDTVVLSLAIVKQHLAGSNSMEAIKILLKAQPDCTLEQAVALASSIVLGEDVVLCNPPAAVLDLPMADVERMIDSLVSSLPDSVDVIKPAGVSGITTNSGPFGKDLVTNIHKIRMILRYSFVLPILFLLLVAAFAIRSLKSWLRWWGIPVFFAGLFTGGVSLAATPLVKLVWTNIVGPKIPAYLPPDLTSLVQNLVVNLTNEIFQTVLIIAGVLLVVGLAAWVISYFVKPGNKAGISKNAPVTS